MSRSKNENKELCYTLRVGGRVFAAFKNRIWAETFTHLVRSEFKDRTVELYDNSDNLLIF